MAAAAAAAVCAWVHADLGCTVGSNLAGTLAWCLPKGTVKVVCAFAGNKGTYAISEDRSEYILLSKSKVHILFLKY